MDHFEAQIQFLIILLAANLTFEIKFLTNSADNDFSSFYFQQHTLVSPQDIRRSHNTSKTFAQRLHTLSYASPRRIWWVHVNLVSIGHFRGQSIFHWKWISTAVAVFILQRYATARPFHAPLLSSGTLKKCARKLHTHVLFTNSSMFL